MEDPVEIDFFQVEFWDSPQIEQYVKSLEPYVSHWVKVRGDGNCYYTAFAYGLLHYMTTTDNLAHKQHIYGAFNSITDQQLRTIKHDPKYINNKKKWNDEAYENHTEMLGVIDAIVKGMDISVLDNMKQASFDYAIVRALRILVKRYLKSHKTDIIGGLPLQFTVEGAGESWDQTLIDTDQMGKEGELFTSLCTSGIFAVSIKIHQLQTGGNKSAPLETHNFINGEPVHDQPEANVYISFRPGHYDGLKPGEGEYTPGLGAEVQRRKQIEQQKYNKMGKRSTVGLKSATILQLVTEFAKGRGFQELNERYINNAVAYGGNKNIEQVLGNYQEQLYGS